MDFSDDRSAVEEPSWRTFAFTRERYAEEFARLNARYVYDRANPPPKLHLRDRRVLYYAAAAALLAAAIWWLKG